MNDRVLLGLVLVSLASACGGADGADDSPLPDPEVATAETFVDAFYSFDQDRLAVLLASAAESGPEILSYQAWAQGGHYEIIERMPCKSAEQGTIGCSITVRDDLIATLELGWWVTDHFDLTFEDGEIVSVETSSNDPQVYLDASDWVRENLPELIAGPCERDSETSVRLTPGLCAAAMTQGYLEFTKSEDFPEELPKAPGGRL